MSRLLRQLSPHGLVRLALGLAFAGTACTLALLMAAMGDARLEHQRSEIAAVLEQSDHQHIALLHVARHAAKLSAAHAASGLAAQGDSEQAAPGPAPAALRDSAELLARELHGTGTTALALDGLIEAGASGDLQADASLRNALQHWQQVREHLWYRGQVLLRLADEPGRAEVVLATTQLQQQLDASLAAAQALDAALQDSSRERLESMRRTTSLWVAGVLVALGLLALAVLEPSARLLQARVRRRQEQATEMERLALVAEHTQAMVIITDREDRIVWANAAFTRLTGWSLEEARGHLPRELLQRNSGAGEADGLDAALAAGHGVRMGAPLRTREGAVLWVDVDLRPLRDAQGTLTGFVSVSTDVTDRMRQRQKLQALWAALPVGVVVHDERGRVADANRAAERLLGLSLAQLQGRDPVEPQWRALHADGSTYAGDDYPALRTLRSGRAFPNELMGIQLPDGELRWLQVNTEPQFDAPGQVSGVVACFSDVTESRHLQEQLRASARTDALTTLPNRAEVMERLKRAIDHAQRHPGYGFAVLFMDFDRFKQVNDTLGHAAGDELLRQISERLRQALRPGDALARVPSQMHVAARIGGDEFVVVLDGMHQLDAVLGVAHRLLADLSLPYTVNGQAVQSSASIGIVLSDGQPATAEEVLRNADTAMYEAKRAGRGRCVVFDRSMHERVVHTLGVEADLRAALKDDQIFVAYQPVVGLADGGLVGVEALVRWRHPVRGLVPPLEFVGIAEECGLIDAVGSRVLELACAQFMLWQHELGPRAPQQLAVNLSRAQLKRGDLVDEVRRLLLASGMPPRQLQLEITETLAAQDERIQATLRELKALGVGLALDDFGTGYSSLACLHQMPVDTVKIDRSFVRHAETVEYHRVLIEATIRVARTLGMRTVAEGIEAEGQAALMRALRCDDGQGWLYGHAMTAGELLRWVQSGAGVPVALAPAQPARAATGAAAAAHDAAD